MKEEISLIELFEMLKKRLGMIIGLSFLGFILSFIFTFFIVTPLYSATTQMLVSQTESSLTTEQLDIQTHLQLIDTYKDIIKGPIILDDVRDELDLDLSSNQLSNKINILTQSNSQVFSLQVTDHNPYVAAEIANTTAEIFQKNIDGIMNVDNVTIISEAVANPNHITPNETLNLAVGFLLGLMSGVGIAFVLELLDNTVKDSKFVTEEIGWTNLGLLSVLSEEELMLEAKVPELTESSRQKQKRV